MLLDEKKLDHEAKQTLIERLAPTAIKTPPAIKLEEPIEDEEI